MKIVNMNRFVKSILIISILIISITLILINKSFSYAELDYKEIYVSSGDTLWSIAKFEQDNNLYFEYKDVREIIYELKHINNLKTSNLKVGDKLEIPII